jgi:hypothetical protein
MDKQLAKQLGQETKTALEEVAAKHGLKVEYRGGRFDSVAGSYTPKIEFVGSETSTVEFERNARALGVDLKPGDKFMQSGRWFKVVELKPRSPKYPLIAEGDDGKRYKFGDDVLYKFFGREAKLGEGR